MLLDLISHILEISVGAKQMICQQPETIEMNFDLLNCFVIICQSEINFLITYSPISLFAICNNDSYLAMTAW